jgi:hypothetical protein
MCSAENLLIGCWKTKKWVAVFWRKSSLAMRCTFNLMGAWTHKTVRFGEQRILGMIHEKPLHAQWATVWCEFWAGGEIGLYFFKNEARNAVTVNGVRYHNMIEFLWPQLDGMDMEDMVPAGRRNLSHCARNNWVVVRNISWPCHLVHRRSELATEVMRRLSLGVCEILCLCQQITNNSWDQGGDSTCHWRNWATIMQKCHQEFHQKSKRCQQSHGGHLSDIVFHN